MSLFGSLAGILQQQGGAAEWSPLDLSGLLGWYDADQQTGSGAITTVPDRSGNGYDLTATTFNTATDTINGLNVFTGASANSKMVGSLPLASGVAVTEFIVLEVNAADTEWVLIATDNSANSAWLADEGSSSTAVNSGFTSVSLAINGATATPTTRGALYAAVGNSPAIVRSTATPSASVNYQIGYAATGSFQWAASNIAEVIVATGVTAGDISDTEAYLSAKWGITI